jgi:RimJ/RimL family protein N-acetyltransferase
MNKQPPYLFTSDRLGFRTWTEHDIAPMAAINADVAVMQHFPSTQSKEETINFVERMQQQQSEHGYCYFALDELETGRLIGFTGLAYKDFETDFTPCTDIGWRLASTAWNRGYATEAAKRCLQYGFQHMGLKEIVSMAPLANVKSITVMQKAGMHFIKTFQHPLLLNNERLRDCALYGLGQ